MLGNPSLPSITLGTGPRAVTLDTPVVLAPMSGVTDLPFRRLAKRLGTGMVVSEMIASWAMVRENQATLRMASVDGGRAERHPTRRVRAGGHGGGGAHRRGPRRQPDRHQFRLPGEEGGGRAKRRIRVDARRIGGGADPGGDRARGAGAGDAEDAHGLGPRQPERPAAGADRGRVRYRHGDGARPHPAAILYGDRRLGLHREREGRRRDIPSSRTATSRRWSRRRRRAPGPARTGSW